MVDRSFSNFFTYSNPFNHQPALYMYVQLLSPFYTLGTRTQRDLMHSQQLQLTSGRAGILRKGVGIQPLCSSPLHSTTSEKASGNTEILHNLRLLIVCLPTPSYLGWKQRIQKDPLEKYWEWSICLFRVWNEGVALGILSFFLPRSILHKEWRLRKDTCTRAHCSTVYNRQDMEAT